MNGQIEKIEAQIIKVMQTASSANADKIKVFANHLSELSKIKGRYLSLESELEILRTNVFSCKSASQSEAGGDLRGDLYVSINWAALGSSAPNEVICERKGSDTLLKVITRINEELGNSALLKLCVLKVNRGPLVTRDPQTVYSYAGGKKHYQSQIIPGTTFSVLTQNSTDEKVDICWAIGEALGIRASIKAKRIRQA